MIIKSKHYPEPVELKECRVSDLIPVFEIVYNSERKTVIYRYDGNFYVKCDEYFYTLKGLTSHVKRHFSHYYNGKRLEEFLVVDGMMYNLADEPYYWVDEFGVHAQYELGDNRLAGRRHYAYDKKADATAASKKIQALLWNDDVIEQQLCLACEGADIYKL